MGIENVVLRVWPGGASEKPIARPYNPLSVRSHQSTVTLLVKKYGCCAKMGSALHALKPGESVELKGPNQQWSFVTGQHSSYGFVAGGTGITPVIQAIVHVLEHDTA